MKRVTSFLLGLICIALLGGLLLFGYRAYDSIGYYREVPSQNPMNGVVAYLSNLRDIKVTVDGEEIKSDTVNAYVNDQLDVLLPVDTIDNLFGCSYRIYDDWLLVITKGSIKMQMELSSSSYTIEYQQEQEDYPVSSAIEVIDNRWYIPISVLTEGLGYSYQWSALDSAIKLNLTDTEMSGLPARYDLREQAQAPAVKNQEGLGTCWAFATLTAMETVLMPEETLDFSEDHISLNNSFGFEQNDGGYYMMAMAYLAAWQGPVLEEMDPYGDGVSPEGLLAVKHVQEIQVLAMRDFEQIKEYIYYYGGVQSSLYTSLENSQSSSEYYNKETFAYYYPNERIANHDVVIIGWDDTYAKENFNYSESLEGNGAFICLNSWGEDFGEGGIFYVSYYDANIGTHNLAYTGIEAADNYDFIYQTDLCGWLGQMGFEEESAYFANVYTAGEEEQLEAVSFYNTGINSNYEVYVVKHMEGTDSFAEREKLTEGELDNKGYYTITLPQAIPLNKGQTFAVVVKIKTPGAVHPIAVEYVSEDAEVQPTIDSQDGEGYISSEGGVWQSVEDSFGCNVCLKAFTSKREQH